MSFRRIAVIGLIITVTGCLCLGSAMIAAREAAGGQAPARPTNEAAPTPLTVDSMVGELLDNPAARRVLERQVPVLVNNPQIAQARATSLRALQPYVGELLSDSRLQQINDELARTPGAVTSSKPRTQSPAPVDFHAALELKTVPLWEGRAPDALGARPVDTPTLTLVGPDGATLTGSAVIVIPGGGYNALATGHEGREVADWFAAHGVYAFVLTYRLLSAGYHHPVQLHDAQRAIRWVRSHAENYGIHSDRIGVIGFSAGGHLSAMTETLFDDGDPAAGDPVDRASSRPDFAILGYAGTQLSQPGWTAKLIAGPHPDEKALRELSPADNVTSRAPPTFIFHTTADETVEVGNALAMYRALHAAHVPVEMHIFANGRHGLGLAQTDPVLSVWPALLQNWLAGLGLLGPAWSAAPGSVRHE